MTDNILAPVSAAQNAVVKEKQQMVHTGSP